MFKLLRYFSITSFIAFVIVAILSGVLYQYIVLNNLIEIAESKNVALTQAFSNSLWPQFAPFVASASELSPEELKTHPQIAQLRQVVMDQMKNLSVVKVKVYNLDGLTVFSTEAGQIGEDKSDNAGFLSARAGNVASELTHRDTFSAFEGTIENRDVFSSYIPIRRGSPEAPIEGIFEVYDDVTPLINRMERTQRNVVGGVALIFVGLYTVLFFIVKRADTIIRQQYSELKQGQQALRESEARFRRVVSSISDHIYMTEFTKDGEQRNHYISPNVEELTGYPLENFLTDWNFWPSTVIHPADRAAAATQATRLSQGKNSKMEYRLIRADGKIIWVRDSGRTEINSQNRSVLIFGVVSDITEHKRVERTLAQAHEQALGASRLKSQLLANVSHDLRTPLNAILGYTDMLQEGVYGPLSGEQRKAIAEIIDSAGQLLNFVNNLLDQARIESGQVMLKITEFTPTALIDSVISVVSILARTKNLELTYDIAADVPQTLYGDIYWLRQILVNLAGNAIKFTGQGSVHINIYLYDNEHWAINVSDTGVGIPTEAQSWIFEPFQQVDGTITRPQGGSGLGLSIVKQLTTLMGGRVTLTSKVGHGSTFTILLPLAPIQEKVS